MSPVGLRPACAWPSPLLGRGHPFHVRALTSQFIVVLRATVMSVAVRYLYPLFHVRYLNTPLAHASYEGGRVGTKNIRARRLQRSLAVPPRFARVREN